MGNWRSGPGFAANSPAQVCGRTFKKGRSGNPAKCRPGSRNRATLAAANLLAGETEGLTRTTVQAPFSGDLMAVRLCVEHLLPVCRERPVKFELPPIETTEFERRLQHLEGMLKAREAAQARGTGSTWALQPMRVFSLLI